MSGAKVSRRVRYGLGVVLAAVPLLSSLAAQEWYVDDLRPGGFGAVHAAFLEDLPAGIAARFPQAARCRAGRAIAGSSMGGYGALLMALDRPDLFAAAAAFSPSIFRESGARTPESPNLPLRAFGGIFGEPLDWTRFDAWTVVPRVAGLPPPGAPGRPVGRELGPDPHWVCSESGTVIAPLGRLGRDAEGAGETDPDDPSD